jgi:hypothetical protein
MRERKIPLDQRSMLRARARWAQAEDINDVVRLREGVLGGDILRPLCCGTRLNFDGRATLSTDQMVVMRIWRARMEQAFAILLK